MADPNGAAWRGNRHVFDHVVESPVSSRGLAGGPGGREPADGCVAETLRVVTE